MKTFLRRSVVAAAFAIALAACHKKEAEVAREAEQALPPEEQVAPAAPAPTAGQTSDQGFLNAPMPAEGPAPGAPPVALASGDGTMGNAEYEAWFRKYHLDLNDPAMLDADPDGDGASNRDEFLANTDPHHADTRPGVHPGIRLKEFSEVRLPVIVESVAGGTARIRRTDGAGKVETVKAGDTLVGLPLKVQKVTEFRDVDKGGNPVDRSTVLVEDSSSKERLTLVKDMPARTAATFAVLTSADGAATVKVKEGDLFKWPGDESATYKVVELREDQVVLQQQENRKMWTVTRAPKAHE